MVGSSAAIQSEPSDSPYGVSCHIERRCPSGQIIERRVFLPEDSRACTPGHTAWQEKQGHYSRPHLSFGRAVALRSNPKCPPSLSISIHDHCHCPKSGYHPPFPRIPAASPFSPVSLPLICPSKSPPYCRQTDYSHRQSRLCAPPPGLSSSISSSCLRIKAFLL